MDIPDPAPPDADPAPPARRSRWPWIAAAVALAAAVVVPNRIHSAGRAHYEDAKARLVSAGMCDLESLRSGVPPVDFSRQTRWSRILQRAVADPGNQRILNRAKVADWIGQDGPEPAGTRAIHDAAAPLREEAAALLAEGPVVAGGMGEWLLRGGGPVDPRLPIRSVNVWGIKSVADLFLYEAAFSADPAPALASLDRAAAVLEHAALLIDGVYCLNVEDCRDEVHARLAAAGRLPREAGDRWLAEEPGQSLRLAGAVRGERLLSFDPTVAGLESGAIPAEAFSVNGGSSSPLPRLAGARAEVDWWFHGLEACARVLEIDAEAETALREGRPPPPVPVFTDAAGELPGSMGASLHSVIGSAVMARQRHRLARAFVRAVRVSTGEAGVPADEAELRRRLGKDASILDGGPLDFPILYERVEADRLRLGLDLKSPRPPALAEVNAGSPAPVVRGPKAAFVWRTGVVEGRVRKDPPARDPPK